MFTHRRKDIGEAKVGLTKHHSRVPPFFEKLRNLVPGDRENLSHSFAMTFLRWSILHYHELLRRYKLRHFSGKALELKLWYKVY